MLELSIRGLYDESPACLALRFREVIDRSISAEIDGSFSSAGFHFLFPCTFLGYDLLRFSEELTHAHRHLDGIARLTTFDERINICIGPRYPARHEFVLGARLARPSLMDVPDIGLLQTHFSAGLQIVFSGIIIDQSHLPHIAASIRSFLREQNVNVKSPWERDQAENGEVAAG
jgi:hypothetical protein